MPKMPGRRRSKDSTKRKPQSGKPKVKDRQQLRDLGPFSSERHLLNRLWMIDQIRSEVIGPDPRRGSLPQVSQDGVYDIASWEAWSNTGMQINGEEVLINDPPLKRYGAGILFPRENQLGEEIDNTAIEQDDDSTVESESSIREGSGNKAGISEIQNIADSGIAGDEETEEGANLANSFRPSAIGLSLLSSLPKEMGVLQVQIRCARYKKERARIAGSNKKGDAKTYERHLWLRCPIEITTKFDPNTLRNNPIQQEVILQYEEGDGTVSLPLKIVICPRTAQSGHEDHVYSISLVHTGNGVEANKTLDECSFFQVEMEVFASKEETGWIYPYPEPERTNPEDEEEQSRLQYRQRKNYGIGHGCSVDWEEVSARGKCSRIWTDVIPTFETPPVSPEAVDDAGNAIRVNMDALAHIANSKDDDGYKQVRQLIDAYALWISNEKERIQESARTVDGDTVDSGLLKAAVRITKQMDICHARIEDGLSYLFEDEAAMRAFRLANRAMLLSQEKNHHDKRSPIYQNHTYIWPKTIEDNKGVGIWRSFQISFILMCLRGACDPKHDDRKIVDLIWFATGGGKTEAYLGLIAFTVFYNRITGNICDGADVLMRYTLRLLTSQQFQRAALLFCAMEHIRVNEEVDDDSCPLLGQGTFQVGLWVGGTTTPNSQKQAVIRMKELKRDPKYTENAFPVLKCPWCHAAMGPINLSGNGRRSDWHFPGYEMSGAGKNERIDFYCPDGACMFSSSKGHGPLPVKIIDEDIYTSPPNLIISTIDKFAGIPFNPEIKRLFGLNDKESLDVGRIPPSLIIQDELHLISGPLGTVAGLYETLIEDLCCQYDSTGHRIRIPKIVASTATISRSKEQIRALYARTESQIFPPPGLNATDSFFAHEEPGKPGRMYMGILAPNHGSQQTTQARVIATALEAAGRFPELTLQDGHPITVTDADDQPLQANSIERDPFWTMLLFFNSLRELGGAASLLVSDVPDYQKALWRRWGGPYKTRYPDTDKNGVVELTSRISGNRIPEIMESLENSYPGKGRERPIDVCLATNIIEVGVDIDRLSLMGIVGQPKTTAQYIQVSSRIGRKRERPGLVLVMYQAQRPRDRSFYEHFRVYHSRLYAQVEPTSVTPFSPPSIMRALHAIVVGYARMYGEGTTPTPSPFAGDNNQMLQRLRQVVENRVECVDIGEKNNVLETFDALIERWNILTPQVYGGYFNKEADLPLIHPAGMEVRPEWQPEPWPTMTSMRNVDVTCEGEVTSHYNETYQKGEN